MLPLAFANEGEEAVIRQIRGTPQVKQHLADLGFVAGGCVRVVSRFGGNVIVNVKEARVAISAELAQKIMV